jgi:broad specificity phosphatase PhoE/ADP-ribose pyrophosphatase YjhB (NUDIX family)
MTKPVIHAAGGVLWRPAENGDGSKAVEVALVHRPRYDDWSIPKGKLAPGESELEGAIREVHEETGFRAYPGRPLGQVRYLKAADGVPREKRVRYWAMQAAGGAFVPGREVDDLRWMPPKEAKKTLTRPTDQDVLDRFVRGPALTRSVLFVRHASAGNRARWKGDDRLRPLDEKGHAQAEELVRLLSRFDVQRIISADYLRCVQTMQPLSEAIGIPIEEDDLVSDDGIESREAEALRFIRRIGQDGKAVVVCSQRDVIPGLIQELAQADKFELSKPVQGKKASVWVLSFKARRLHDVESFPPPTVCR